MVSVTPFNVIGIWTVLPVGVVRDSNVMVGPEITGLDPYVTTNFGLNDGSDP
jgi:hypothetical protein